MLEDAQREFGQKVDSFAKELREEASYVAKKSWEEFERREVSIAKELEQLRWEEIDANRAEYRLPTRGPVPRS